MSTFVVELMTYYPRALDYSYRHWYYVGVHTLAKNGGERKVLVRAQYSVMWRRVRGVTGVAEDMSALSGHSRKLNSVQVLFH